MHDGWMWGMHWGWWSFWVLIVLLVIWAATRSTGEAGPRQDPRDTPLEALQRRYAEGEISTEEYEERKSRLQDEKH